MSGTTDQRPELALRDLRAKGTHDMVRRALLAAGVMSSLLYVVATDVIAAARWDDYTRTAEMVSKLFAVGSPARPVLIVLVGGAYTALMIVFGFGIWASAQGNRALRATGALLIAYGASNIVALFFPLDLNNHAAVPMHIVATNSMLVLMLAAMGFSAAAFHGWLRVYAIASLLVSVVAGIVSFMAAPHEPNLVLGISAAAGLSPLALVGERVLPWPCGGGVGPPSATEIPHHDCGLPPFRRGQRPGRGHRRGRRVRNPMIPPPWSGPPPPYGSFPEQRRAGRDLCR
jgi:hypothetical protein